ncbi:MAG TPA: abortive phage infection protein [Firmicutes bacterium]|nr:abortive phage infection protein [Bacillota bacterium]
MTFTEQIVNIAKSHNGMVTAKRVTEAQIPRRCLTECVKKNILFKVDRGVYVLPNIWEDEMFIFQYKYPKGIFSFGTALYLHGLTDRTLFRYTMTFPQGYNISAAKNNGVDTKIVTVKHYTLGVMEMNSPCNNKIRVYDQERTLCDIVRGKNTSDVQVVNSAMKSYIKSKDKNINKLYNYAEKLRVKSKIAHYMEVLL